MATGSTVWCGLAPWPPLPWTRILKESAAAPTAPGATSIWPTGISAAMWSPKTASIGGSFNTPAAIIGLAPPVPCSSDGWKRTFTVPENWSRRSTSKRATANWIAVWASWPQACMTPSVWDLYSTSFSSWIGSASISARISTLRPGPGFVPRMTPVTPVIAMPVWMSSTPSVSRRWRTNSAVLNSWKPGSGFSCSHLRSAMTPGRISSTAGRMACVSTIGGACLSGSEVIEYRLDHRCDAELEGVFIDIESRMVMRPDDALLLGPATGHEIGARPLLEEVREVLGRHHRWHLVDLLFTDDLHRCVPDEIGHRVV